MKELDDISAECKQCDVFLEIFLYFNIIVAWNGLRLIAQYLINGEKHREFVEDKGKCQNTGGDSLNALHYCITVFSESKFNNNLLILVSVKLEVLKPKYLSPLFMVWFICSFSFGKCRCGKNKASLFLPRVPFFYFVFLVHIFFKVKLVIHPPAWIVSGILFGSCLPS